MWFRALSTSELVADNRATASVGGVSCACLVVASASEPGLGAWLAPERCWGLFLWGARQGPYGSSACLFHLFLVLLDFEFWTQFDLNPNISP